MKKIFKYPMPVQEKIQLDLPIGAQILRVADMDGLFFLWAIIDPDEKIMQTRFIEFYKTGQPIPNPDGLVYLGLCCIFIMQELGLYTFERIKLNQPYTT